MTDQLAQGAAWLEAQRHKHMTRDVFYQRGTKSLGLPATVGRTEFAYADDYGVVHRLESRDFLVRTEDLVLSGVSILPRAGDQIIESGTGKTFRYEVMSPGGEPPYRYSDPERLTLRIHTKLVGA